MDAAAASRELADYAAQRADLYFLLATLFLEALNVEALEQLLSAEMSPVMKEAGLNLIDDLEDVPLDELAGLLSEEFTRLFLFSPDGRLAPYESLQKPGASGLLNGPEAWEVSAYIESAGFEYSGQYKDMPDHISVQLGFLAHLAEEESNAFAKQCFSNAANTIRFQQEFFQRFIGTWVFAFLEKIIDRSEVAFYSSLARFTADFLRQEQADIENRLVAIHQPRKH